MKTIGHTFSIGAGQANIDGNAHWPDFVRLNLPRERALSFALDILRQVEYARPDAAPTIEIPLFGELVRAPEDDLESPTK